MKVKVLTKFKDRYTGEIHKANKEMTISAERFEEILSVGPFVEEIVEAAVTVEQTEEKPKATKGRKKKKTSE